MSEHPESYPRERTSQLSVTALRDQIAAPARPVLLVLLAAAGVVFIIACSNVANLILARSVRREGELAVRAALGASRGALRRTLLAESLVLCGAGAVFGVLLARPMVAMVVALCRALLGPRARSHRRRQLLWVGAGAGDDAAVLLAFVPRLPSAACADEDRPRLRQHAHHAGNESPPADLCDDADRVLVRAARRRGDVTGNAGRAADSDTGYDMRQVLAIDLPMPSLGVGTEKDSLSIRKSPQGRRAARRRRRVARQLHALARCRRIRRRGRHWFGADGYTPADGEENPRARLRIVAPDFFNVLGVPLLAAATSPPTIGAAVSRGDRQPERRAASVPERRCAQSQALVDRSVLRSEAVPSPHRRRGRRRRRREHRAAARR